MSVKKNVIQIWKSKGQIFEGLMNNIFKKEDVEEIAEHRLGVCKACTLYDESGKGCAVPGTQPCCNEGMGGCGCSLSLKTRSLSSECPLGYWKAVLSQEEEDKMNEKLGL